MKIISFCTIAAVLLLNSCGTPAPVTQLQSNHEPAPEEKTPNRWQKRAGQSALVISGALIASCLLVAKVRKLCVRIIAPDQVKSVNPPRVDETTLVSAWQSPQHSANEIALLHEELAALRKEYEELHSYVQSNNGRTANILGSLFEHDTVKALPKIISDLYSVKYARVVRNVEGSFSKGRGKNKNFEIDAIAITDEQVFVIETKLTLTRRGVDRFAEKLENFQQIKFKDRRLNKELKRRKVHGGLSYQADSKFEPDGSFRAKRASDYAYEKYKLLTIPQLVSDKAHPKQVDKLHDFSRQW